MRQYVGLIHKEEKSDYSVSFPDFPGCVTAGATLDEARALAEEALAFHVEGMVQDGEAIPEPSSLESIMADEGSRSGVAILVPSRSPAPKTVRVNITLPDDVLSAIDRYAESHGYSRSGFIAKAARDALKLEDA
ncbi:MAG TPA: type II toxin-antitoxin system HicB family antitoxin [Methylocella sp.]|jgi:predicted RNase H-like HicB family nuclease